MFTLAVELEAAVRERPEDPRIPSALGQVYAGMGRKDEPIREGLGVFRTHR